MLSLEHQKQSIIQKVEFAFESYQPLSSDAVYQLFKKAAGETYCENHPLASHLEIAEHSTISRSCQRNLMSELGITKRKAHSSTLARLEACLDVRRTYSWAIGQLALCNHSPGNFKINADASTFTINFALSENSEYVIIPQSKPKKKEPSVSSINHQSSLLFE